MRVVAGSATVVVLAAGASRRLGRPKQLVDFRGAPLLAATLETARAVGTAQVVVVLGGAADEIRERVDLSGVDVALNVDFESGCATSIRSALGVVEAGADGVVLMLGDQPGVTAETVRTLLAAATGSPVGFCEYDEGPGHPLWFARSMFDRLAGLHGDKAVWKIIDEARAGTIDHTVVRLPGPIPRDVDTWADYVALVGQPADERNG
jgi:molybdenum cofactor cytidylyltransferase